MGAEYHGHPVRISAINNEIESTACHPSTFAREQKLVESVTGNHNISGAPSFDLNVPRNVTTAVGQTAFLHCRVHHMGDKELATRATCSRLLKLQEIWSPNGGGLLGDHILNPFSSMDAAEVIRVNYELVRISEYIE
ncbi:hypothetical protein M0802_006995 [Mischocyttarus mexicanus]|nr:hypothetical protein M0802_006995 [Mischocyttarus mexicanus]